MATRSERIAAHIAARIVKNTKKRFSALHADALEEIYRMATPTSSTLNGGSTFVPEQTSDANESVKGQLAEMARPRMSGGDTMTGMTCGSQVPAPVAKPVDSKTLTGSYPGDHRAKAAPSVLPQNPGPREGMTQAPLSSRTPAAPKPESFLGAEGSDQN